MFLQLFYADCTLSNVWACCIIKVYILMYVPVGGYGFSVGQQKRLRKSRFISHLRTAKKRGIHMAYKKTDRLIAYNNQYNKDKYDRFSLMLPKGKKEVIQNEAKKNGESVNAFINRAIDLLLDSLS